MPTPHAPLTLAIAGLGAIGLAVARRVDAGELPGITLVAAAARDRDKARRATAAFRSPPPLLSLASRSAVTAFSASGRSRAEWWTRAASCEALSPTALSAVLCRPSETSESASSCVTR